VDEVPRKRFTVKMGAVAAATGAPPLTGPKGPSKRNAIVSAA